MMRKGSQLLWALSALLCLGLVFSSKGSLEAEKPTVPASGSLAGWQWADVGDLNDARELPRLATWAGGVIIVGGGSEMRATALDTTEIFDRQTHKWRPGPQLRHARRDAEVVKLNDGRLLAIGGSEGPTRTGSPYVEAMDPTSNTWAEFPSMSDARIGHTAVLLQDGRLFVAGGQSRPDTYLATAEIVDPRDSHPHWKPVPSMKEPRSVHHARLLGDGRVIVIGGGTDSSATDTVEIFDPKTEVWKSAASMKEPRWGFASAVMADGRVMVAGGRVPARKAATLPDDKLVILRGVEIYDPAADSWSDGPVLNTARTMGLPNVDLIKLKNGRLLFVGGRSYPAPYHGVASAEMFAPTLNRWVMIPKLSTARSYQASILLPGGEILVAGGRGPQFLPLKKAECFEKH